MCGDVAWCSMGWRGGAWAGLVCVEVCGGVMWGGYVGWCGAVWYGVRCALWGGAWCVHCAGLLSYMAGAAVGVHSGRFSTGSHRCGSAPAIGVKDCRSICCHLAPMMWQAVSRSTKTGQAGPRRPMVLGSGSNFLRQPNAILSDFPNSWALRSISSVSLTTD